MEAELAKVRERRAEIEERVASGEDERRAQAQRLAEARGAVERLRARIESVESAERELRGGLGERQLRLTELGDEPEAVTASAERIAELEAELETLKTAAGEPDAELEQLRAQAAAAAEARARAQEELAPLVEAAQAGAEKLERATRAREMARAESEKAAQRLASLQGELAAVEAKLARAAMEGDDEVLAGLIETGPGIERALSAALGEHLRAIVVGSVAEGVERIGSAEGASRALVSRGEGAEPSPPVEGARRLLDLVKAEGAAGEVASRLLADAWIVDTLTELPDDFTGIAVTVDGEAYDGSLGELRSVPREGTDPALAARSQREELVSRVEQRERTVERAQGDLDRAEAALAEARAERDETDLALREARRALDEATEEARRASWLADKRAEREQGPTTLRRAQLDAELAAERRHAQAAERLAAARRAEGERLRRRIETETETLPALAAAREALARVLERVERRADAIGAPGAEHGGEVAQELRECSKLEFELGGRMREVSEALTTAEVGAAQLRDRRDESRAELERLAASLDRELGPAEAPLGEAEREEIGAKLERLTRRREQIGPVNPLAAPRVRGGERARPRADRAAQGPGAGADRDQGADPPHGPRDRAGLRGDLRRHRAQLRGDGGRALPGGQGAAAEDRGRPAEAAADDRRRAPPGARTPQARRTRRRATSPRTRPSGSRSRSRRPASPPAASRSSPAARSRWSPSPSSSRS